MKFLKVDLHVHTRYSLDSDMPLEDVIRRCQELGIDGVAICDHGTIEGALEMQRMAPPFMIIIAEEVLTTRGEIMGLFLRETIPSGLSVAETVARIREQQGLILIPHPFDGLRSSAIEDKALYELVAQGEVDVLEVFNSKTPFHGSSLRARKYARDHNLLVSAGSDAHSVHAVGNAYVEMPPFTGRDDFLAALAQGKIVGRKTNYFTHVHSLWAKIKSTLR